MRVLYFAWVREQVGCAEETVEPPASVATPADLAAWLRTQGPGHAAAFADLSRLRAAVDLEFAEPDASLAGACEVAFFPPVTGG